jgi:hypothetical protein
MQFPDYLSAVLPPQYPLAGAPHVATPEPVLGLRLWLLEASLSLGGSAGWTG